MKTFPSFNEWRAKGRAAIVESAAGTGRLDEGVLQVALDGAARDKTPLAGRYNPEQDFASQADALLKSRFVGADPRYIVGLFRFSRSWDETLDDCSLRLEGLDAASADSAKAAASKNGCRVKFEGGEKYVLSTACPGKAQGLIMPLIKKTPPFSEMFKDVKLEFAGGKVSGEFGTEREAAVMYVAARMCSDKRNPMKEKDVLAAVEGGDSLPEEYRDGWAEAVRKQGGGGGQTAVLRGATAQVWQCAAACGRGDDVGKARLEANTAKVTYDMVWLADQFAEEKDWQAELDKLRKARFGMVMRSFLKKTEEEAEKEAAGGKKAPNSVQRLFASSVKDMLDDFKGAVKAEPEIEPSTPAAVRRLKLFEDAEYYGAQKLKSNGWVAAICRTYDQAHCFGRGKPKVKEGTNEIDPDLNLRDDEIEAKFRGDPQKIRELKKRRDGGDGARVKDGIGYDSQPFEAGQCVSGGNVNMFSGSTLAWGPGLKPSDNWATSHANGLNSCYFGTKKRDQFMPIIYYLDLKTGKLFCSNLKYTGDSSGSRGIAAGWYQYDFNTEANGTNDGGIAAKLQKDKNFRRIYALANKASFKAWTGRMGGAFAAIDGAPTDQQIDDFLEKKHKYQGKATSIDGLDVSDNGVVLVRSSHQAEEYRDQLCMPYIRAVKVACSDAESMFQGWDVSNFDVIDCSDVEDARCMFEGAYFGEQHAVDLVSTAKCAYMDSMF